MIGPAMRRYVWVVLFFVVLLAPLALRWAVGTAAAPRAAAPVTGGGGGGGGGEAGDARVVIITPHAEPIRAEFARAFSRWHQQKYGQAVYVDYRIYGGASDIVRYFDAAKSTLYASLGTYKVDLVWGGGDDLFDRRLKQPGYHEGVELPPDVMKKAFEQPAIGGLPLYDMASNPPTWFGTALSSFGIVYNRDVLRHLGVPEPKTWADLADPRYRGWIVLADPLRSAVARTTFMVIVERAMQDAIDAGRSADEGWARGMGLVRQIAANARLFTDSGTIVPAQVGTGDVAAGMAIDFQARSQVDAVQQPTGESRLAYVEPAGATAINPDPIALVKGAENREVAVRFITFILGEQGQRLWNTRAGAPGGPVHTSLRRLPVMKSVYASPRNFTDPVNPYEAAGSFNTSRARTATSPVIGELVAMSCIDLLEDLRETRRVILASPRAAELDARLGVFPFDQKEALARGQRYAAATPLQRLELQRHWTDDFRREYAELRAQARR
jgi:ABC-type Fe3+ transport system substrate-binding protein